MTRKKVALAFITKNPDRKASYEKRKKGLLKKAEELSKLCGIDLFVILYGQLNPQPVVYPSSQEEIESLISRFKTLSVVEQIKRMVDQESFTQKRVMKAQMKLKNQQKRNREKEVTQYMNQCLVDDQRLQDFSLADLNDLSSLIDGKLKEITRKMATLKRKIPEQVVLLDQPSNEGDNIALPLAVASCIDGGKSENKKGSMVQTPETPENEKQIVETSDIN